MEYLFIYLKQVQVQGDHCLLNGFIIGHFLGDWTQTFLRYNLARANNSSTSPKICDNGLCAREPWIPPASSTNHKAFKQVQGCGCLFNLFIIIYDR